MQRELKLPDIGEGIAEGEIVAWLVEPGDQVEEDEVLGEVETDKAVVDVPSPYEGTVVELHAEEGDIVEVGSVIVTFELEDESEPEPTTESTDEQSVGGDSEPAEGTSETDVEPADPPAVTAGDVDDTTAAVTAEDVDDTTAAVADTYVFAPPRVRRLARELGVDLDVIASANGDHPISETDVRRAAGEVQDSPVGSADQQTATSQSVETTESNSTVDAATKSTQSETTTPSSTGPVDRSKTLAAPATRQLAREHGVDIDTIPTEHKREDLPFVTPDDVEAFVSGNGAETTPQPPQPGTQQENGHGPTVTARPEERIEYRGIRKAIGDNMEEAKYNAPHVSHHDSTEIERLVETRGMFNDRTDDDVSITYLPFIIKAAVKALKDHPYMNSTLDKDSGEIILKEYYDIGIATATERGLVVPVLENADQKGVRELAEDISELTSRARSGDLSPDEMRGSTFTVSNFGAIGGDYATPIINYPEAAILGLGAIKQRPTVADGQVTAQYTLPLSLTVDHRLIDGAVAAQFTNDVKSYLSTPEMLML